MKIEWQAEDIKGGRIVGKPDRTERWMIGYVVNGKTNLYCLISLSDGMVQKAIEPSVLARQLNESMELPVEFFSDPTHSKRGKLGAAARAASLSPERRAEIASTAARKRWAAQQ